MATAANLYPIPRLGVPPFRARLLRAAMLLVALLSAAAPLALGVPCTFATVFHYPCPGCGMTRAMLSLGAGDLHASLAMHPLAVPVVLINVALGAALIAVTLETGNPIHVTTRRYGRLVLWGCGVVYGLVVALYVARAAGVFGGPVSVDV